MYDLWDQIDEHDRSRRKARVAIEAADVSVDHLDEMRHIRPNGRMERPAEAPLVDVEADGRRTQLGGAYEQSAVAASEVGDDVAGRYASEAQCGVQCLRRRAHQWADAALVTLHALDGHRVVGLVVAIIKDPGSFALGMPCLSHQSNSSHLWQRQLSVHVRHHPWCKLLLKFEEL